MSVVDGMFRARPDEKTLGWTRREALRALALATSTVTLSSPLRAAPPLDGPASAQRPSLGVALGGGGAKGLAHVSILQALEAMGVVADRIAGTSAGAVIGALYASGLSPSRIRAEMARRFDAGARREKQAVWARYMPESLLSVAALLDPAEGEGGLLDGERFIDAMLSMVEVRTFEDLKIPLDVVATDYWTREPVVISSGPLKPALLASMALPGIFAPVVRDGRVLLDGGLVDPIPFDLLAGKVDKVMAVDIMGERKPTNGRLVPTAMEAVFQSFQIMEKAIVAEKRARFPVDIYVEPPIANVAVLEFHRAEEIYAEADRVREGVMIDIGRALGILPARDHR